MESKHLRSSSPWLLLIMFAVMSFLLLVAGHFYYKKEEAGVKTAQHKLLSAVSTFKVNEIRHWMDERRAEGVFISSNPLFLELINKLTVHPRDPRIREEIAGWIIPLKKNHEYRAIGILGTNGKPIIQFCDSLYSFSNEELNNDISFLQDHSFAFSELMVKKGSGKTILDFIMPLKKEDHNLAFVIFRIDPEVFLFPFISSWPVESTTAENLLVIPENGGYVCMNKVAPASGAIIRSVPPEGTMTLLETRDYRGVDVLADVKPIPGTSWKLISKIDYVEISEPLRKRAVNIVLYLITFLGVIIVSALLIWKNQQYHHYRSQYELQSQGAKAEERIRFMNALLEEVNDAIITFDKDLMIQSWNKGAEKIYGWKAAEVVGKYGGGSLRVDFPGASREIIFKALEQKGFWKGEVMHKRKDGTTAYLLCSTSQLKDENGDILGIININKDISEVVQSEKVKNAVYRISELAHAARDINELYASIHIVIGELMDARNLYIAMVADDRTSLEFPYFVDEQEKAPEKGPLGHGLTEHVLRTGKPLLAKPEDVQYFADRGIIEIVGTPAVDWLGIPLRIEKETIGVLVIQSYSPKIRFGEREKDILTFVSEQIALSIQRKKIQQELIEAIQKAEVSSKLTSALLANMNHELRTPMNGILGFAEILMNELNEPGFKLKAENILLSGRRLMDTLDAIMDLSFLESDKVTRKLKPVSVSKKLRSVLMGYETQIKRKGLSLDKDVPEHIQILGDDHLFSHLLKNLIDNAVKYTDTGGIKILAVRKSVNDHPMICISISDTGIGIAEENHAMIFHAFRQVSEGYGRQFEGSGLGLSISKKIVTLMNGTITLHSRIGEGSTFTVCIPSAEEISPVEPLRLSEAPKSALQAVPGKLLPDVLLVEDNLINLQLLMVYIRDFCNVYSALDGKSAIDLTHQRQFHAILMDINLGPGMDGIQAMLEIRKRPDYAKIPIIAVTGYASIGDRDRLLTIGFDEYLPKPFDRDKIADLMSEFFPGA